MGPKIRRRQYRQAGRNADERTTLHRVAMPMFQMNGTRLRNQIKERLMIEGVPPNSKFIALFKVTKELRMTKCLMRQE
jgi:hypothetical protein